MADTKNTKKTLAQKIEATQKDLADSRAEVKDWAEIASSAKDDRVKSKALSAQKRYAVDVEYNVSKIARLVMREIVESAEKNPERFNKILAGFIANVQTVTEATK